MLKRIGSYEVEGVIGEGGMGTVYLGRDPRFDRAVAIKVLHEQFQRDPGVVERFKSEAVIQAKLNHPSIVTVHDFVADGSILAIVMERVEGQSLSEIIERGAGPLAPARAVRLMDQMLSALGYAHSRGLVHRDIKPSNVLVQSFGTDEIAKVMDFGIAKILGTEKHRTATSAKMGTLAYMSPEHVRSPREVDVRSDVYSLGVVLYEMLTGRMPFDADSEYELMRQIVRDPAPDPRSLVPSLPGSFSMVVAKGLEKDPAARFPTCEEMREALSAAQGGNATLRTLRPQSAERVEVAAPRDVETAAGWTRQPGASPSIADRPAAGPSPSRAPLVAAAAIVLLLLGAGGAWLLGRGAAGRHSIKAAAAEPVDRGSLVVRLDPPAKANLDGWQSPDGGQRDSSQHTFSGLEPRTYRLKVWRDGYAAQTRNVSVASSKTTTLEIRLQR
jgi:serine/threonine-protein kinase